MKVLEFFKISTVFWILSRPAVPCG